MTRPTSLKRTLILGAAWTIGTRWLIKGLGFINTVIMARLLLPADYGIVAMSMLIVGLIQAILDFGAATALLRKGDITRDEIDSAWTLRLLENSFVGTLLLVISPFAAAYFKEPRVEYVLWIFAVCVAISGAGNIGFTLAQKEFNFSLEFRLNIISKSLGVVATISAGLLLRDYRALVIGVATGYVSTCVMSYWLHPYRARWNTSKIGDIWKVTKWLMFAGVGNFILRKGDEMIAGRIGSTSEFGLYNVGADLGQLPTGEIGPAMLRAFLPILASMRGGVEEVNAAVLKTVAAVNTITMPIGFGFAAVALPATHLLLGPSWGGAAQFVTAFAFASTLQVIQSPFNSLLVMRGHTKVQGMTVWLEFAVFLIAALTLVPTYSLIGLVWARMVGSAASLVGTLFVARAYCSVHLGSTIKAIVRPLMGATAMYLAVTFMTKNIDGDALKLALGIIYGFITYCVFSTCSWLLAGRPEGIESIFLGYWQGRGRR